MKWRECDWCKVKLRWWQWKSCERCRIAWAYDASPPCARGANVGRTQDEVKM